MQRQSHPFRGPSTTGLASRVLDVRQPRPCPSQLHSNQRSRGPSPSDDRQLPGMRRCRARQVAVPHLLPKSRRLWRHPALRPPLPAAQRLQPHLEPDFERLAMRSLRSMPVSALCWHHPLIPSPPVLHVPVSSRSMCWRPVPAKAPITRLVENKRPIAVEFLEDSHLVNLRYPVPGSNSLPPPLPAPSPLRSALFRPYPPSSTLLGTIDDSKTWSAASRHSLSTSTIDWTAV